MHFVEDLTFAYESGEHVLKDVNYTVTPRKVHGIVGPSGGGETTFFSLLQRLYQPLMGSIKLGQEAN